MRLNPILATALLAACTYAAPEDHVTVQNLAINPDGSRLAVVVKYERYRVATGLAAFPDGGVPRVLIQRADFYVVDLQSRALVYSGELPAPSAHRLSFSPWLIGWDGDTVYFKVTGCPGKPGDECWGPLVQTSMFTLSPPGTIAPAALRSSPPKLLSSIDGVGRYVSVGTEPYGVSISKALGATRVPLMRFAGVHLEVVPAQDP